ncbi:MAG: DUF4145 domain-containing protein [FCB group bacterium]|nr:DUF4145 domain-containing protein [FCB group bacterium]
MNWMQIVAFVIIVLALVSHGFSPNIFMLDKYSICLLFLLAIPLLTPYLKKAKWFGAEFEFRDEIEKTASLIEKSEEVTKESRPLPFSTFSTESARQTLDIDPNLSLAALRIDIERILSHAVLSFLDITNIRTRSLRGYMQSLTAAKLINPDQAGALLHISHMCNKAVHGHDVTRSEAIEIIELTERLNQSFSIGYSINVDKNDQYADHGLICEWEHCIEHFPLLEEDDKNISCQIFGHNCPGGSEVRIQCILTMADFPPDRHISEE